MSQMVIRESSNLDETSSDSELSDWQRDNMDYAKNMTMSVDKVDERLINIYRIRKAHQMGIHLGFNLQNSRKPNRVTTNFAALLKSDIMIPTKSFTMKK
jgi:hypothetical protein